LKKNDLTTGLELASQTCNRERLGRLSTECYFTENNETDIHTPIKYHTNTKKKCFTNVNHIRSNKTFKDIIFG